MYRNRYPEQRGRFRLAACCALLAGAALAGASACSDGQAAPLQLATESSQSCDAFTLNPGGQTATATVTDRGLGGVVTRNDAQRDGGYFLRDGGCANGMSASVRDKLMGGIICTATNADQSADEFTLNCTIHFAADTPTTLPTPTIQQSRNQTYPQLVS